MTQHAGKTLYLIDGHYQIFRSYHAIRNSGGAGAGMVSPVTGEPTFATFAFAAMLLKLFGNLRPSHVAMAIDAGGSDVREALYPEYKGTRTPPADDFKPQEERIFELVKLFGMPILAKRGAEADDIIATVCTRLLAADPELHIRIVAKDKDLEQLLSDRVTMYDIHTDTEIDPAALFADKGITPAQVVDVLALTGDTIDNVPGVEGVGIKTAAKLVTEYGSLENLLANLDKIKGKRRENLEAAKDLLPISKKLVALMDDIDVPFSLDESAVDGKPDVQAIKLMFRELGFRRHVAELERIFEGAAEVKTDTQRAPAAAAPAGRFNEGLFGQSDDSSADGDGAASPAVPSDLQTHEGCDYRSIQTREDLEEIVAELRRQPLFAVDTETRELGPRSGLAGVSLAWSDKCGVYVPVLSPEPGSHLCCEEVLDLLRPVLEDPSIPKCGHNLKYDLLALRHHGVELRGVVFDSMIGAALLGEPGIGLDALAMRLLRHQTIPITDLIDDKGKSGKPKTIDAANLQRVARYAAEDADVTLRLVNAMRPRIVEMGLSQLNDEVETPLVRVLADMETAGIAVDPDELERQRGRIAERVRDLRDEIVTTAGVDFSPDSPKQLAEVLFNRLKLPVVKRTKTGPSTDVEVLQRLAERETSNEIETKLPSLVIEYRELSKLLGTYLEALKEAIRPGTGRVHTTFNQVAAATGRLSSNDPNLQNIPIRTETGRQIRKAFVAAPNHRLVVADYSQIELRVLAHLSDDAQLRDAFANDLDVHTAVASQVFNTPLEGVTKQQRGYAKTINFGIIYGVTAYGLARRIEGLSQEDAKKLIADYRKRFSGIDRFLQECVAQAMQHGYVSTIMGRRRAIPQVHSRNGSERALGERLAINSVVQGSAADMIKVAMVRLHARIEREKLPMRMLLQIHDELVCEAPEADAERCGRIMQEEMERAMQLSVPLKVDVGIGRDWFSAK